MILYLRRLLPEIVFVEVLLCLESVMRWENVVQMQDKYFLNTV
jgi:hypothetical protein